MHVLRALFRHLDRILQAVGAVSHLGDGVFDGLDVLDVLALDQYSLVAAGIIVREVLVRLCELFQLRRVHEAVVGEIVVALIHGADDLELIEVSQRDDFLTGSGVG